MPFQVRMVLQSIPAVQQREAASISAAGSMPILLPSLSGGSRSGGGAKGGWRRAHSSKAI